MDGVAASLQHLGHCGQAVHGHPWAMCAALAGGTVAGGGASMKTLPGLGCAQLVHHPLSVATMNSVASSVRAAARIADVEPTASARPPPRRGLRVHQHLGLGCCFQLGQFERLNSSCTMRAPFQNTMSAPVSRWI